VSSTATIRPVRPEDVPAVVSMVHDLATFEDAPEQCHLTEAQLHTALFGPDPALFGHVAEAGDRSLWGFALWFLNFSTWEGAHGIYLEDLYVRPEARGTGVGRDLLTELAAVCVDRGYKRLDWCVLDWNPARAFYTGLGAAGLTGWIPHRLEGAALTGLAASRR